MVTRVARVAVLSVPDKPRQEAFLAPRREPMMGNTNNAVLDRSKVLLAASAVRSAQRPVSRDDIATALGVNAQTAYRWVIGAEERGMVTRVVVGRRHFWHA